MDEMLKLLIDDFQNHKPSAEYRLILSKVCEAETTFMNLLSKKQKSSIWNSTLFVVNLVLLFL